MAEVGSAFRVGPRGEAGGRLPLQGDRVCLRSVTAGAKLDDPAGLVPARLAVNAPRSPAATP